MSRLDGPKPGVLIVTQHYAPEPNFITADVAEALARDHRVTVVTAHPNYPLGRFYPGTRYWFPRRTVENGVVVWRLPFFPDHSGSKLRRALAYGSFSLFAALFAPFVGGRPSAVWVYQSPPTAALAALWFKLVHRSRVVLMYADLWPESFIASGVMRDGAVVRGVRWLRTVVNRMADAIVGSTPGTVDTMRAEGAPADSLHMIPVWVGGIPSELPAEPAATEEKGSIPSVVYAGNLGPSQNLEPVIAAAAELYCDAVPVRFDLYGSGLAEQHLKDLAAELGAGNVHFHGRVPPEEAFLHSARALAQVVALRPDPLFAMTIPSKLFFCLAAGAPVLYSLEGDAAAIAAGTGGAIAFDPTTPSSLTAAVRRLLEFSDAELARMRAALREAYRTRFERRLLIERHRAVVMVEPDAGGMARSSGSLNTIESTS